MPWTRSGLSAELLGDIVDLSKQELELGAHIAHANEDLSRARAAAAHSSKQTNLAEEIKNLGEKLDKLGQRNLSKSQEREKKEITKRLERARRALLELSQSE